MDQFNPWVTSLTGKFIGKRIAQFDTSKIRKPWKFKDSNKLLPKALWPCSQKKMKPLIFLRLLRTKFHTRPFMHDFRKLQRAVLNLAFPWNWSFQYLCIFRHFKRSATIAGSYDKINLMNKRYARGSTIYISFTVTAYALEIFRRKIIIMPNKSWVFKCAQYK